MDNQELYHHGVKGMRWGHRKAKRPNVSKGKKSIDKKTVDKGKEKTKKILTGVGIGTAAVAGSAAVVGAAAVGAQLLYSVFWLMALPMRAIMGDL